MYVDGTYAVDEKEGDLFSDASTVTGSVTTSQVSRGTRTSAYVHNHVIKLFTYIF